MTGHSPHGMTVLGVGMSTCALALDLSGMTISTGALAGMLVTGGGLALAGITWFVRDAVRAHRSTHGVPSKTRSSTVCELLALDCRHFAIALGEFLSAQEARRPVLSAGFAHALQRVAHGVGSAQREAEKAERASRRREMFDRYYRRRALAVFDEAAPLLRLGNDVRERVQHPTEEQLESMPVLFRDMADDLEQLDRSFAD